MFHQWKDFVINWYAVHMQAIMAVTPALGICYFKKTTLIELVANHSLNVTLAEDAKAVLM